MDAVKLIKSADRKHLNQASPRKSSKLAHICDPFSQSNKFSKGCWFGSLTNNLESGLKQTKKNQPKQNKQTKKTLRECENQQERRARKHACERAATHGAPWRCLGVQTCWEIAWNCIKPDVLKTNNGTMK